jgi:tetratricopeptide (TPR) repeat protein
MLSRAIHRVTPVKPKDSPQLQGGLFIFPPLHVISLIIHANCFTFATNSAHPKFLVMTSFKTGNALALIAFLLLTISGFSQHRVDSVYMALKNDPDNIALLNDLSEELLEVDPFAADSLSTIALSGAQRENNKPEELRAMVNIVNVAWGRDFIRAMEYAERLAEAYGYLGEPLEAARHMNDAAMAAYELDLYDKSLSFYRKTLDILLELDDQENIPSVLINMGQAYEKMGLHDSALYFNQQAIGLCQAPGFEIELSTAYGNQGVVYKLTGDFDRALGNYQKAYDISKKLNDSDMMATDLNNIAAVYLQWEKYALAKDYFERALHIYQEAGRSDHVEITLNNIANLYQQQGKYDTALVIYLQALAIARKMERTGSVAIKLGNIGVIFYELKNYDSAIYYQQQALAISRELGHRFTVCNNLQNLGESYLAKNDLQQAEQYFKESLECARDLQAKTIIEKNYKSLSQLYERLGKPQQALDAHKQYDIIKDSIFTSRGQEKLAEMEALYKNEKKQQQIELLLKDKEFDRVRIRKNHQMLWWAGSTIAVLLIAVAIISTLLAQKSRANRLIVEKNLRLMKEDCNDEMSTIIKNSLSISEDEKIRLMTELNRLFKTEKIFTRKQLTLTELAEMLNTNTAYLSHIFNTDFDEHFTDLINRLRVEEAQKQFVAGRHKIITIEAISESVGFNSRTTFNIQFKKFAGVTPSVFIKNLNLITAGAGLA